VSREFAFTKKTDNFNIMQIFTLSHRETSASAHLGAEKEAENFVFGGNYQRQTETQSVYIMHCVWNKFYEIAPLSNSIYTLLGKISLSEITKRRCAVVAKNGTAVLRRERPLLSPRLSAVRN
jgi:hypothetical protein